MWYVKSEWECTSVAGAGLGPRHSTLHTVKSCFERCRGSVWFIDSNKAKKKNYGNSRLDMLNIKTSSTFEITRAEQQIRAS